MPRIFDNIEQRLRPALAETMGVAHRADFCVGYFNLRGWRSIDARVDGWAGGPGHCCRILVGMQRLPHEELRAASTLSRDRSELDNQAALRLKKGLVEQFREQLTFGAPTNQDEAGLRKLARQIRARKVVVRLFLRHRSRTSRSGTSAPDLCLVAGDGAGGGGRPGGVRGRWS